MFCEQNNLHKTKNKEHTTLNFSHIFIRNNSYERMNLPK